MGLLPRPAEGLSPEKRANLEISRSRYLSFHCPRRHVHRHWPPATILPIAPVTGLASDGAVILGRNHRGGKQTFRCLLDDEVRFWFALKGLEDSKVSLSMEHRANRAVDLG